VIKRGDEGYIVAVSPAWFHVAVLRRNNLQGWVHRSADILEIKPAALHGQITVNTCLVMPTGFALSPEQIQSNGLFARTIYGLCITFRDAADELVMRDNLKRRLANPALLTTLAVS
jgi:hypothetical protein